MKEIFPSNISIVHDNEYHFFKMHFQQPSLTLKSLKVLLNTFENADKMTIL